jgi:AraC-like DNA-binding protein
MKHAGKLLTGTDMTIRAIAAQLGYTDSYHFARRFREVMGKAPGRYRKN